jgi:hypothetical protein
LPAQRTAIGSASRAGSLTTPTGSGWLKLVVVTVVLSSIHRRKTSRIVALSSALRMG